MRTRSRSGADDAVAPAERREREPRSGSEPSRAELLAEQIRAAALISAAAASVRAPAHLRERIAGLED